MTNAKILSAISRYMIRKGETIAIAESVTAGLIMSNVSSAHNASLFFQGGITAYNLGQKTKQLKVEPIHAEAMNCVSEQTAQQMACEVSNLFCSQWGISITGYATPVPELKIKSCFAIYAIAYNRIPVLTNRIDTKLKRQESVKKYFADHVITTFANHINEFK
ncbi:MAG: nicotinamide-nucleotide amidohydrolase family protein [Chryseolinea sp.]